MLDRNVQQSSVSQVMIVRPGEILHAQTLIEPFSNLPPVLFNPADRRPISRFIRRKSAIDGINAEREQLVELRSVGPQSVWPAQQIPIKSFQMSQIKNQSMAFGNRAIVKGIRRQQPKNRIRA